jgi:hypothetical protein
LPETWKLFVQAIHPGPSGVCLLQESHDVGVFCWKVQLHNMAVLASRSLAAQLDRGSAHHRILTSGSQVIISTPYRPACCRLRSHTDLTNTALSVLYYSAYPQVIVESLYQILTRMQPNITFYAADLFPASRLCDQSKSDNALRPIDGPSSSSAEALPSNRNLTFSLCNAIIRISPRSAEVRLKGREPTSRHVWE